MPFAVVAIGLIFAAWQLRHLDGYTYAAWQGNTWNDYDEGVYISSAWQLNHGSAIFSQVFSSQPLLFLAGLSLTLQLAGADAGHLYPVVCGLIAMAGAAWLAWEVTGRWSALLATALLAISPGFVIASHAIEAEAPMMAFGGLAVAASARYARFGERRWIAIASLLLAAATLSKLLAIVLAVPLVVAILLKGWDYDRPNGFRATVIDAGLASALVLAPIIVVFATVSPRAQWDQVIGFHLHASAASVTSGGNWSIVQTFLGWDPGLVALAIAGLAIASILRQRLALIPAAWLVAGLVTLVRYQPLFVHHLTVLLPALAVAAGLAAGFTEFVQLGLLRKAVIAVVLACATIAYLIWLPDVIDHSRHVLIANSSDAGWVMKMRAASWLDAHSALSDTVVTDDQVIAVLAHRQVPAQLTDTSTVRCTSGYLPLNLLVSATTGAGVKTVLLTRALRNNSHCSAYLRWLRSHYREVPLPTDIQGATAFVAPRSSN